MNSYAKSALINFGMFFFNIAVTSLNVYREQYWLAVITGGIGLFVLSIASAFVVADLAARKNNG